MKRLDTLNWRAAEFPRMATSRPDSHTFYVIQQERAIDAITLSIQMFLNDGADFHTHVIASVPWQPGPIMSAGPIRAALKDVAERYEGERLAG